MESESVPKFQAFTFNVIGTINFSSELISSTTLDNLDNFLRFCNPRDGVRDLLMVEAGSDGFASLSIIDNCFTMRDRHDVLITKAIRDADGWTDHCLVLSPDEAPTAAPTKAPRNQITKKLDKMHAPDDNATVETRWCQLRNVIQSTALEFLGHARRQHHDCFDDNDADISNLLAEKNGLHKAYMDLRTDDTQAGYFRCRRLVQQRLREMQDAWMLRKAEEIQGYADRYEMKNFFKAIKAIYGPCTKGTAPLLSSDGTTLLTEKSQILKRWTEHFRSVLNCSSAISDAAIDRLPQVDTNNDLDLPPSLPETIRAVQQISSGKSTGSDAILLEVYKH
ncbi:unnamed protein product, partial [Schistocephalus solidus]|uniref:Uncharacterized protein n=1 Tax=Schistocephalus solidus TaxID=70667 RepID=A0A183SLN9_SCHSO